MRDSGSGGKLRVTAGVITCDCLEVLQEETGKIERKEKRIIRKFFPLHFSKFKF
jgi:hypothetical protein